MSELYMIKELVITTRNGEKSECDRLVENLEFHCSNCEATSCFKWIVYDAYEDNILDDIFVCKSNIYCPLCGRVYTRKKESAC